MEYTGSCHCGKVQFKVEMNLDKAISCNCSICSKRGSLLAFAPESRFQLLAGKDDLKDYQFGPKRIHHYFCTTCGILPFGAGAMPDGTPMRAINIRCLDGVEVSEVPVTAVDGKKF